MGNKMNNAPVFYTLAQVRFNPVSLMSESAPKIQDRLRRDGFPDFLTETTQHVEFKVLEGRPDIQTHQQTRWNFMNSQRSEGYILYPDSLVFHTTSYDIFEVFLKRLVKGLELVHETVTLSYVERIGLRYLNVIHPELDKKLDDYLVEKVLGLSGLLSHDKFSHSLSETMIHNSSGTLVSRVLIREDELAIPAEFYPLTLKFSERFLSIKGRYAILDNDQFIEERTEFNIEEIESKFTSIHELAEQAFKAVVTPYTFEQYK